MGNPAGVQRDFDALEKRRVAAMRLLARWVRRYRLTGVAALKKAGRAGRKPRLSARDRQRLVKLLLRGPEALGYQTPLWTCPRVAHLIESEFQIRYHEGHVWKLLISLGWSPQRPTGRARERNEEAIRGWQKNRWPAIKEKPEKRAARSSSSTRAE